MKIEILNERENPLLRRKEITFRVTYKGATPKFMDVRKELISQLKSSEKLTIVDSIKSEFGATVATGYAKMYEDEKALSVEPKNHLVKNFEGKKKKKPGAVETKPEEKKGEKAAEEEKPNKEEKHAEEKKPEKGEKPKTQKPSAEKPRVKEESKTEAKQE